MKQVFHPYQQWEGFKSGMYEPCKLGRADRVMTAKQLLTNPEALKREMTRVTIEWPIETEHVLTDASISHRAWLGQSACNIYADVKEDETREAWGYLTEKQRREANRVADAVDDLWCKRYSGGNRQMTFLDLAEGWL
jgi:hypothetical protein